jgi:hypothetical protein
MLSDYTRRTEQMRLCTAEDQCYSKMLNHGEGTGRGERPIVFVKPAYDHVATSVIMLVLYYNVR